MRIIDMMHSRMQKQQPFHSFEFFPPKTDEQTQQVYNRLDSLKQLGPMYVDVTFGAGGSTTERSMQVVETFQNYHGVETMLHLTCTNMTEQTIRHVLEEAKSRHLQNIMALRGDPAEGQTTFVARDQRFQHAVDLVRYIRREFGDYFGIAVAGYPEKHIEASSYEEDLQHLKEKVDAGADFIVTQMCFSPSVFEKFVNDCRALGITCPIIPGILLFGNYAGLKRMAAIGGTTVPAKMEERLQLIKDDNAAVSAYAVDLAVEMVNYCMARGMLGFHFYVLNLEKAVKTVVTRLGWPLPVDLSARTHPFLEPAEPLEPTIGDATFDTPLLLSQVPAYRQAAHPGDPEFRKLVDRRTIWGATVAGPNDVSTVFASYYEGKIHRLPWCEFPLARPMAPYRPALADLARRGVWVINAQQNLDHVSAADPQLGWRGPHGSVLQLAALECFVPVSKFADLLIATRSTTAVLHACDAREGNWSNTRSPAVPLPTAWHEPGAGEAPTVATVMDTQRWFANAPAVLSQWHTKWGRLYPEDSPSRAAIGALHEQLVYVSLVAPSPSTSLSTLIDHVKTIVG